MHLPSKSRSNRALCFERMEDRRVMTIVYLDALMPSEKATFFGASPGDRSGSRVSNVGDINGDGFDDLSISTPYADGIGELKPESGESYIVFGRPSLPSEIDLSNIQDLGLTIYGADPGDYSGVSVNSAGDFNGDGIDDLLVGSFDADSMADSRTQAGEGYVIFGSKSFPVQVDLSVIGRPGGVAGVRIYGAEHKDGFGFTMRSAGDFNGDGINDIIASAPWANGNGVGQIESGECYIIFGSKSLPAIIDLANFGAEGIKINGVDAGDWCGRWVSGAGDVNGDGFQDVIIGAFNASGPGHGSGQYLHGESYIVFGGSSIPQNIDLENLGTLGVTINGAAIITSHSGWSVSSAGDFNADGLSDVLIGANGNSSRGGEAGATYLIYGSRSLPSAIYLSDNLGGLGTAFVGTDLADKSGYSVSNAGDVNQDGFDDIWIGSPGARSPGSPGLGESYLIYGSAVIVPKVGLRALNEPGMPAGRTYRGVNGADFAGISVSNSGDINGDGFQDLLIGAYKADARNNAKVDAGESYLIYGGNFTNSVTHLGTSSAETLTGNASANRMNGEAGNDILVGNGGADILVGGQGDDILAISDGSFKRVAGGTGNDTLRFDGAGVSLNLGNGSNPRIQEIEVIDITGSGDNELTLSHRAVLNLSEETNTLLVRRNAGDTVNLGDGWTQGETENISGTIYQIYTQGNATVKLQIGSSNRPPMVVSTPSNASLLANIPTEIVLPDSTFSDPDPGQTLTWQLKLADGGAIPSWIQFDAALRKVRFVPLDNSPVSIALAIAVSDSGSPSLSTSVTWQVNVTANPFPMHSTSNPLDVDQDRNVSPLDVLSLINWINAGSSTTVAKPLSFRPTMFLDVDADNTISPLDVLAVINYLNNPTGGEGEGRAFDFPPLRFDHVDGLLVDLALMTFDYEETQKKKRSL